MTCFCYTNWRTTNIYFVVSEETNLNFVCTTCVSDLILDLVINTQSNLMNVYLCCTFGETMQKAEGKVPLFAVIDLFQITAAYEFTILRLFKFGI